MGETCGGVPRLCPDKCRAELSEVFAECGTADATANGCQVRRCALSSDTSGFICAIPVAGAPIEVITPPPIATPVIVVDPPPAPIVIVVEPAPAETPSCPDTCHTDLSDALGECRIAELRAIGCRVRRCPLGTDTDGFICTADDGSSPDEMMPDAPPPAMAAPETMSCPNQCRPELGDALGECRDADVRARGCRVRRCVLDNDTVGFICALPVDPTPDAMAPVEAPAAAPPCPEVCHLDANDAIVECRVPETFGSGCRVRTCALGSDTIGFSCTQPMAPSASPASTSGDDASETAQSCPEMCRTDADATVVECRAAELVARGCRARTCALDDGSIGFTCTLVEAPGADAMPVITPVAAGESGETCEFSLVGRVDNAGTPVSATCRCGEEVGRVNFRRAVNFIGETVTEGAQVECYGECLEFVTGSRCTPSGVASFENRVAVVADTCCVSCVVVPGFFGDGVSGASDECVLLTV